MSQDTFNIEVLPDGRLKLDTDNMQGMNHGTAEDILADIVRIMGGEVKTERKAGHKHHTHTHKHTHTIRH